MGNLFSVNSFNRDFALIIAGALIFIASFLWKDFFSDLEDRYFPQNQGLIPRFFFILMMSVLLVCSAVQIKNYFHAEAVESQIKFDDDPIGNDFDITDMNTEGFRNLKNRIKNNINKLNIS